MTRRRDDPEAFDGNALRRNAILPGSPWWVRLLFLSGMPPALIVILLVAVAVGWIRLPLMPVLDPQKNAGVAAALTVIQAEHGELMRRLTIALRVMCENQAQTVQQQRNCGNIQ